MRRNFLGVLLALTVAACASVPNPLTDVTIFQLKNGYAIGLELAKGYDKYCHAKPYKQLMLDPVAKPICQNRRTVQRNINTYGPKAGSLVRKAEAFVDANPTVSAASLISPAWDAVIAFQNVIPRVPAQ